MYDVLKNTHSSIGHGGRDRMIKELSNKYKNIAPRVIELFLRLCELCQQKQKKILKGSVERANQDIKNMPTTWMQEQNTSQWSQGLHFIQIMKNGAYHLGIKTTPYEALFGCKIKIGLNMSNLPKEVVENIETEEDLTANTTKNLEIQADKMKKLSDKTLLPSEIGSTVWILVPDVDKGRLDARNILAVVTEVYIKNILS